jgi:ABC-type multidrug transport system permease subunit
MALFRFLGALLKTMVVANTFGMFVILLVFIFGGFLIPRGKHAAMEKHLYLAS